MRAPIGLGVRAAIAWAAAVGSILLGFGLLAMAALVALVCSGAFAMPSISWQDAAFMYGHSPRWVAILVGWTGAAALLAILARRLARRGRGPVPRRTLAGSASRLAALGLAGAAADAALVGVLLIHARWYSLAWL